MFFITSLGLSYMFSQDSAPTSVMDRVATPEEVPVITAPPVGDGLPAIPVEQNEAAEIETAPEESSLPPAE